MDEAEEDGDGDEKGEASREGCAQEDKVYYKLEGGVDRGRPHVRPAESCSQKLIEEGAVRLEDVLAGKEPQHGRQRRVAQANNYKRQIRDVAGV